MKVTFYKKFFLHLSLFSFFYLVNGTSSSLSLTTDVATNFLEPVACTQRGLESFFKNVFNHPDYASEFLPYNFSHLTQLLQYGKEKEQPNVYTKSVLKLFLQKIKSCPHINAYEFCDLLEKFPSLVDHKSNAQNSNGIFEQLKKSIKELLHSAFLNKFSFFQEKPDEFLDELSIETAKAVQGYNFSSDTSAEQLSASVVRFIENGLGKIIWSPTDQHEIWNSFKMISLNLEILSKQGIILELDDLDDLYWSLMNRFCYFVDTMAIHLNPIFYAQIKKDLEENNLPIFHMEEQEELLETKIKHLAHTILKAEAKARMEHLAA